MPPGISGRTSLDAIMTDRNTPQKHVWWARSVLSADAGCTAEITIMSGTGTSKTCAWR
jgi:hypothetical protein